MGTTATVTSAWLSFPEPNPKAEVRLFCFPYAGGSANIFYKWRRRLAASIEICLVHLPGGDNRLHEQPFTSMTRLIEALCRQLLPYIDKPSAFFGHSLGALVGFELARCLRNAYGWQPSQIFVSGCSPAHLTQPFPQIHLLPAPQFLRELKRLGEEIDARAADKSLVSLMLPALRADLALRASYAYTDEEPLDCAIKAYGGAQDRLVDHRELDCWQRETTGSFALRIFDGGHFFIETAETLLLKDISDTLERLAPH